MSGIIASISELRIGALLVSMVDILIVAFIIYRVLLLIRGTRAAYMLIGLLVVGVVFIISQQFSLMTVRWLLDNVVNYLLLIVIIVFQADIRRGLMRMGRRMFGRGVARDAVETVEEVVIACEVMAAERVGALLVFEREVDLDELIHSGNSVDAELTSDLLLTLFGPSAHNPLHDGAVVIRGGRIRLAGAVLGLSSNPTLDRNLGTRHRAAVGITEDTDAVSVVVSEERGDISVCHQGLIKTGNSGPALRRELLAYLTTGSEGRAERPSWIRRIGQTLLLGDHPAAGAKAAATPGRSRRRRRTLDGIGQQHQPRDETDAAMATKE